MKVVTILSSIAATLFLGACDKGTSSDPSTTTRDELQPPTGLRTVTWDKKIELRWRGANVEKEFKGYHVFAVAKKISDLTKPTYPTNLTVDLKTGSVPRCEDNSALFEAFGFKATTASCKGDADESAAAASTKSGAFLAETADTADTITNIVPCDENADDKTISLPLSEATLGEVTCTVSKLDADTPLENGTTYTFFVAAVRGDEKKNISWTSNFVEDTPAASLYTSTSFSITGGKFYLIPAAKIEAMTAIAATDITSGNCEDSVCKINQTNDGSASATDGIFIGRLGSGSYPQRIFLSVPTDSSIKIVPRGNQVLDPADGTFKNSIPGDRAADTTYAAGQLYPIYGNQVFDLEITKSSTKYYGKIVFGQPVLATVTDPASVITVPMAITVQPDAGNFDYFTGHSPQF